MTRVFITGSSDGIGLAAAKLLADQGHAVVLHARSADRAASTRKAIPNAEDVLVGDLRSISETKKLAQDANGRGPFDTVIHNAGIGYGSTSSRETTSDNISAVFAVNTLAPYILTCLMDRPSARLLYMSSDSHLGGDGSLRGAARSHSYGDSKLHDLMLAKAFGRRWEGGDGIEVVSMHPGWVRTKMGGSGAPGSSDKPAKALAEWAVGKSRFANGSIVTPSGKPFTEHPEAGNQAKQEELLGICKDVSGVAIPGE